MTRHGVTDQPLGPFDTEGQARAAALAAEPGMAPVRAAANRKLLSRVCAAAGVALGRYDDRIVEWLSIWEASTVAAVAGWAGRAHESGLKGFAPCPVVLTSAGAGTAVIEVLRSAADALARDLATWEARDPAGPSAEARQARRAAIAAADAVRSSMARLRARLGGGRP
jgi:hypothetical protein